MSESAPEPLHPHGGKNVFAGMGSKLGPLPVWAWGLLLGTVAVWYLWMHEQSTAAATATPASADATLPSDTSQGGLSVADAGYADEMGQAQSDIASLQAYEQTAQAEDTQQDSLLTQAGKIIARLQTRIQNQAQQNANQAHRITVTQQTNQAQAKKIRQLEHRLHNGHPPRKKAAPKVHKHPQRKRVHHG